METTVSQSQQPYIESTLEKGTTEEILELFKEIHPADLAEALEELEDDRWDEVLKFMPAKTFGALMEHLPAIDAAEHLGRSTKEYRKEALSQLKDDELVDFLQERPDEERETYVGLLSEPTKEKSRKLLAFPETSAGGRMTADIATVRETMTIRQAIEQLATVKETSELLARIYVVDERKRLLGKVRLRDLTFNPRDKRIAEIMDDDRRSVDGFADQEEAARKMKRYDLLALPVVNPDRELLGIITHDDAMDILEEESTEDMEMISGIQASDPEDTYLRTSVFKHFKRRSGWVTTMAFLAIASGFVLYHYEHVLSKVAVLALYIPMVVAAGGNTGSQSATMVIRAMSLGELDLKNYLDVIWKEIRIGVLLGGLVGICIFFQIQMVSFTAIPADVDTFMVACVVGLALMLQIVTSTMLGSALPMLANLVRADPAVVASPVITTVVDATGMVIYFVLAQVLLNLA